MNMEYIVNKKEIFISVSGHQMKAHLAHPQKEGKYPAVIVVMELFGVNNNIREITDNIAALGYVAIAPDFYHRTKKSEDIPYGEEGRSYGFQQLNQLRRETVLQDVDALISTLKKRTDTTDKIGIVGFSMGGHIAFLSATKYPFNAVACFYAGWLTNTDIPLSRPEPTITLSKGLKNSDSKLIYFAGENDTHITSDQLDSIKATLTEEGVRYEIIVYPNSSHGFFCDQRPADYNKSAHDDSWERLKQLFQKELQAPDPN